MMKPGGELDHVEAGVETTTPVRRAHRRRIHRHRVIIRVLALHHRTISLREAFPVHRASGMRPFPQF